ncbi:hypothetical protein ACFLSE_07775, partial [Bacteroidota bacterium]
MSKRLIIKNGLVFLIIVVFTLLSKTNFAQSTLEVKGQLSLKDGDASIKDTKVSLYESGTFVRSVETGRSGSFKIQLDIGKDYIFEFTADGYVTKKINIITKVPEDFLDKTFTPIYFAVELFNQYDDVNTMVFTQPVGLIKFYPQMGDFDYDVNYSSEVRKKVELAEKALVQAHIDHKEEIRQEELAIKQQEIAAQKAAAEAARQLKLEEEKAAAEARKKAVEAAARLEAERKAQFLAQQQAEA